MIKIFLNFIHSLVLNYAPKEELIYNKKINSKTTNHGFTINEELMGKYLTSKYKNKNLIK